MCRPFTAVATPLAWQAYICTTRTPPFPSLSRKTSASARKWVETLRHDSREELMKALRAGGFQVLATSCTPEAKPVAEYDFTRPTAIIMGNEHAGVSEELLPLVDGEAYIPMYGMIQSFNVSVAAALMLAEASRQRKLAGMYERMTWTPKNMRRCWPTGLNGERHACA